MKKSGKDSGKGCDSKNAASSSRSSASSGLPDPASLLDPASLFAYWGRDPTAAAAAAAASSNLFGSPFAGSLGLLPNVSTASTSNDRNFSSHPNTMAAAASQAASLSGLHPASWWTMAQYAAQDYFARLSGLPQLPFSQPDFGSNFPGVGGVPGVSPSTSRDNASTSGSGGSGKKKKNGSSGNGGRDGGSGGGGGSSNKRDSRDSRESTPSSYSKSSTPHPPPSSTPHTSPFDYKSLYSRNATNLQKELMAMTAAATALGPSPSTPPKNFSPSSPYLPAAQSTSGTNKSNSGSARDRGDRDTPLSSKHHHHPSPSLNSHSISISPAPSSASSSHSTHEKRSSSSTSSSARTSKDQHKPSGNNAAVAAAAAAAAAVAANNEINFDSSLSISALSSLSQLGNLSNLTSQQSVTAAMNALAASSTKAKDYMSSGILSDPSSFLGVRLPPDTEIIKYTSSIVGPKVPGTTNRGRKKTISLDPNPWVHGAKRPRLDPDFSNLPNAHQNDRIEVIKLPASAQSNGVMNLSKTAAKDTSKDPTMEWGGLGLIGQKQTTSATDEDDTPLNLSMKPAPPKSESMSSNSSHFSSSSPVPLNSNSLQSLTSITAAVGNSDSRSSKEGRPRNLGRGVSKPKKNTVASLLAQSRAVGIKPLLTAQQLMNPVELEKLRQAISESTGMNPADLSNTDTESMAESGMSESEGEEQINLAELRIPLAQGWKRETIIHGLTKNGQIKGDVYYLAPGSQTKLKSLNQIKEVLIALSVNLKPENFSFSPRAIVGNFLQPAPPTYATDGEYLRMTDVDVASRLEELKLFTRHPALGVEQRIEIARHQQALREAKKMAKEESAKNKEKSKLAKELERNERLEQQRKEKELKHQQQLEARKKREEELAKQKLEEAQRKQQIYMQDLNKQKEFLYAVELERERRRQHSTYMKALDSRKKYEEREKKKHQVVLDKLISREKKLISRRRDAEILTELRKPQEDSEIPNQKDLPTLPRLAGLKLAGQALADLLMVFEFLHTFGETLGFDMDSLPSLQSLHQALVSENAVEAEDELLSVITHLIVCAIEDPGIPNPNRHTTLLGQTLRQADITHSNVSEILRIYLYAISTSEVRQLTGYVYEKERRGQELDPEMAAKNQQFLDALHENIRYKLSECLKDKPFVALNPTVKAQILATLCNDLLLNKAVCKQIETSLEAQASLKKERYVIDAKIRKCKLLLTRKTRLESYERAIAQVGINETDMAALTTVPHEDKREEKREEKTEEKPVEAETPTKQEKEEEKQEEEESKQEQETTDSDGKEKEETTLPPPPETPEKVNDRDVPTPANSVASEKQQAPNKTANDTMHEHDDQNSDVESDDGTQMEEDEDASLMVDEIQKNLEELLQEASKNKESLQSSLHQLRAKCYGQDRYWRRYWHLPKSGGIFVEALESAQPEIAKYHELLDEAKQQADALIAQQLDAEKRNKKKRSKAKSECDTKSDSDTHTDGNLSDGVIQHTNKDNNSLVEEKFVQPTPNTSSNDEEMDIEESIPTAILVQKNNQAGEAMEPMLNFNVPKVIQDAVAPPPPPPEVKAEPEETNCDNVKMEVGAVKEEVKAEEADDDQVEIVKEEKPLMEKWFSLIRRDIPLISSETIINQETRRLFCNITCRDQVVGQGHRWEVGNNLYFYTSPEEAKPDANYMISDSIMSLSGLNETEITNVIENITIPKPEVEEMCKPKGEPKDEGIPGFSLPPYMALSLNNLTNYLQCDSPGPVMATPEEAKQLDDIKLNGAPTRLEHNFVPKDLRHGWWKISEIEQLNEVIQSLNPRAIRERNLRQNILAALTESIDLTIPCPVSHPRAPPPPKGFIDAEPMNAWNPQIARRVELALLDQVESFEDKIASASMQVKGWNVPQRENDSDENSGDFINIQSIGERILNLEGAIERRYLKPPLGMNTTEAQLVLAQQKKEQELKEKEKQQQQDDANSSNNSNYDPEDNIPRGLAQWRDAVERSVTCAQLSMALYVLESCVAWDKSIMKANCQFCQSGENEDKLLLCDGCDRGYHTYCFKPRMDKIPEGDWYCFECLNEASGERKCIVCGGLRAAPVGKMVYCDLCPRTYHSDCYIPPLLKVPRGKWYCQNCIGKAPPKKRSAKKRDRESTDASNVTDTKDAEAQPPVVKEKKKKKEKKDKENLNNSVSSVVHNETTPLSPSTTTLPDDSQTNNSTVNNQSTHEENTRCSTPINNESQPTIPLNESPAIAATSTPIAAKPNASDVVDGAAAAATTAQNISNETSDHAGDTNNDSVTIATPNATMSAKEKAKKERKATKKLIKELAVCKTVLDEMEVHEDSWPFLLPVNTKQFPTYKKIIKCPMDLSTIKKRLQDLVYKSRDDFIIDVRTIFNNCEVFNEDDSPVGKAGHGMRNFFETRWTELTDKHS